MYIGRFILAFVACMVIALTLGAVYGPQEEASLEPVTYAKPNVIRVLPPIETPMQTIEPEPVIEVNARDAELIAQTLYGEYRGYDKLQQAGVVWCILNRCDYYGESVKAIVTAPNQFHGYDAGNPIEPYLYDMAVDVLTRWEKEKLGEENVGRVLPKEFMWFAGTGTENIFRDAYYRGQTWDWSLESPYAE